MSANTWTQAHRRFLIFLLAMLALIGIVAAFKLPVSLFPTVDFPRVMVALDAGDQPVEQMEMLITRPVEDAVRRVPGVRSVRSTTSRGSAEISVNFDWGHDIASGALQINAAIAQVSTQLPQGTQVSTRLMDPTVFPIIAYSLTATNIGSMQLRDLAEYELRPLLSSIEGVAKVQVQGGALQEYRVTVDPLKLQAAGISYDEVSKALASANVFSAVGRLEDHYKLYLTISNSRFQHLDQIKNTVLRKSSGNLVHLSDVATIEDSIAQEWTKVTADGKNAVLFSVYQQPGSNSVQIAADVKAKLIEFQAQLPAGVKIANWYDQSQLVLAAESSVRDAILIGIGLSALVLLFFLRNIKVTMIAIVVVPAVLSTTMALLYILGMSFNIMTLGGMAAAVGLIIDDAIVMIEHIIRRLQETRSEIHQRVMSAALEFTRPLAGSSASTLIIFVPLAFLTGVTGAFFKALSLTMAAALLISFVITWLVVPVMADHFLNEKDAEHKVETRLVSWLHARYEKLLRMLLLRPAMILVGLIPLVLISFIAFQQVGSGFMPAMDEGGFVLDYQSAPGTALSETNRLLLQVEEIVRATPEVETYSRRTGSGLGGGLSEVNQGDFFIRLKGFPRREVEEVMDEIRHKVEQNVPGLKVEMAQLMEDMIGDLTAVAQPIEIKLFSSDPAQLKNTAQIVADAIAKISGVVDVKNGINPAGDALEIHIDSAKAAIEGMDADAITKSLESALSGNLVTQVSNNVKMIGVRLWVPKSIRNTDTDLANLLIRAPDGHLFPLKRVATITALTGQAQISRENLKRMVAVTGRISGRDLGSVIADVKTAMGQKNLLPKGSYYRLGGLYEQQQIAFKGLIAVFAAASALVFLLLLFMYESFRLAFSILITVLLAASTVFIGLWVTHTELNISAMMGMTMIVGMVTEVAIFYFSEQQDLVTDGDVLQSMLQAGINRMRPIAMTTIAAMLTLLPLAFAIGHGSEMQQPLAIAIISGLLFQLPLVLLVMPVLFYVMRDKRKITLKKGMENVQNDQK